MSMRNCGFFRDDKDDGDEGLEGGGSTSHSFSKPNRSTSCQLRSKETFWLLDCSSGKKRKSTDVEKQKSDLHLKSFYEHWNSKVRDSKVCIDGHHSKYAEDEKEALMGDG